MFGFGYWITVIILTFLSARKPWTDKVKDGRSSKGYRVVNKGVSFFKRLFYGFIAALIISTVVFGLIELFSE